LDKKQRASQRNLPPDQQRRRLPLSSDPLDETLQVCAPRATASRTSC
jgi:hypothetical protein